MMRELAVLGAALLAALAFAGQGPLAPGTGMAADAEGVTMDAVRYEDFGARGDGTTDDVTTASGRPVRLGDNAFLFRDVVVRSPAAE